MAYKRWITNCPEDQAFERLMKHSAEDPNGYYTIGPPRETITMSSHSNRKGCSLEYLEKIGYRGIYECYPPDFPYDS